MSNRKTKEVHVLMRECTEHLQYLGYSEACIVQHQKKWIEYLLPYLEERGVVNYTPDIGEEYLDSILPTLALHSKRVLTRSVHILSAYLETGLIPKRIVHLVEHPLPGEIGQAATIFLQNLVEMRRKEVTVDKYRRIFSYFIEYLELNNKAKITEIEESDILSFINTNRNFKDRYFVMRKFCQFLNTHKYTSKNLEYTLAGNHFPRREKLPSIYSADEIRQIEASVDQHDYVGKRDYAILLLASRLGLRSSDIYSLKFANIDWEHNKLIFTQYKTGNPVELPLLAGVGEAIVNYLRYGRPVSDQQEVFLSARPPYRPMTRSSINRAVSGIISRSEVDICGRKFGPHSMRHSLASRLLSNGVSLPVISETLGHNNTRSTMEYLRIDVANLIKCTLDVPLVAPVFYEQKGGTFYV
ncbi:tyrosine-type recombinase/integrase [Dysgonomonas sp. GY75]|uniref:site-specific integrase n=1 Tax=Dysgonomonas sp. GY75 TaxID=2780419 RepID=UPI0018832BBD|nr:site-specific integrase [Dysgonomonas sp. GY75]MBF0648175.1 tyrosine-type recombinase/integrase [Dysgonomonas sp. GY75]